jgi:hypothetical protein
VVENLAAVWLRASKIDVVSKAFHLRWMCRFGGQLADGFGFCRRVCVAMLVVTLLPFVG